jgi:acyl-CoA thioesterase
MVSSFATATAVAPVGEACWRAELSPRWSSLVGVHGGYVAATASRAIGEAVGDVERPLRTLSAQFLRSPKPGAVEIEVSVERRARRLVFASARVAQGDQTMVLVRSTSGGGAGLTYDDHRPCPRPATPPDGSTRFETHGLAPHFDEVEVVMDPDVVPFSGHGNAWLAAWLRPLRDEPLDAAWLIAACDVLPPASFARTTGPTRAATLDYTVHLAVANPAVSTPAGSYVYLDCRSPLAADGIALENGALWGPDGTVLAISRQTRLASDRISTLLAQPDPTAHRLPASRPRSPDSAIHG